MEFSAAQIDFIDASDIESVRHDMTPSSSAMTLQRPKAMSQYDIRSIIHEEVTRRLPSTHTQHPRYVRALFSFNPNGVIGLPSDGLAFQHGTILELLCDDENAQWWHARLVQPSASSVSNDDVGATGLVPSQQRQHNRQQRQRNAVRFDSHLPHRVDILLYKFHKGQANLKSRSTVKQLLRRINRAVSRERISHGIDGHILSSSDKESPRVDANGCDMSLPCPCPYVRVHAVHVAHRRPVIVIGMCVERIVDDILWLHGKHFVRCAMYEHKRIMETMYAKHALIACPLVPDVRRTASSVLQQLQQFNTLALQPIVLFTRPDNYEQVHVWLLPQSRFRDGDLPKSEEMRMRNAWRQINCMQNLLLLQLTDIIIAETPEMAARIAYASIRQNSVSPCWLVDDTSEEHTSA